MNANVLIVDDNPANIQLIASVLDEKGFEVEVASSGPDAIENLKDRQFDLILLDVMMPEMNGYDTCKKIKQRNDWQDIPVIFLTAKTDDESISKGFESGGVDYVTKPFNAEELIARVKTHIELKKNREILEEKVRERTADLAKANKEIEEAYSELQNLDEAKNEFINIISHEIRTPLNGILGPLQLLNMENKDGKVSNRMKILNESVERLEKFSSKMILISELRTKRYQLKYTEISVKEFLQNIIQSFDEKIRQKSLIVELDSNHSIKFESDENLVSRLVKNFLDNSIRLSPENAVISVSYQQNVDQLQIIIKDEAGGFSQKALKQLYKPFVPGNKFVNENIGVGMYLSHLITNTLQGNLKIQNTDKGARVDILLPL